MVANVPFQTKLRLAVSTGRIHPANRVFDTSAPERFGSLTETTITPALFSSELKTVSR